MDEINASCTYSVVQYYTQKQVLGLFQNYKSPKIMAYLVSFTVC